MKLEASLQYSQTQKQEQRLILSPQIRFSLDVLRLPIDDVRDLIEEHLLENPLLEAAELSHIEEDSDYFTVLPLQNEYDSSPGERFSLHWEEDANSRSWKHADWQGEVFDPTALKRGQSFTGMLLEQLVTLKLPGRCHFLCSYLIACLDEKGYLPFPLEELAAELGVSQGELQRALLVVQSLEPPGVGARNLQECLLLQLQEWDPDDPVVCIVKEGLEFLAQNNWKKLTSLLRCDMETARQAAQEVRMLNPIPAQGYESNGKIDYIIPDAIVKEDPSGFRIVMNRSVLPRLVLSPTYTQSLHIQDEATNQYIKERKAAANMVIQAVDERMNTLEKILLHIVSWQPAFFHDGSSLRPMSLGQLAEALELHISTISRAVQNKYVTCAAGTLPLKMLFSNGIPAGDGQSISSAVVRKKIAQCIAEEDRRKPLSDEKLRLALDGMGIQLARRTVMKYREILGIPKAAERKIL